MNLFAWFVIFLLIALTALYVAAEFGAVSVRRSQIEQLAKGGNRLAQGLAPFLADSPQLDRYIAVSQVGITLSSLILGAYGQAVFADSLGAQFQQWFHLAKAPAHSSAAIAILVGLTVVSVVLGELIPKSLAMQYSTQVALLTYLPMRWSLAVYSWAIVVLNGSGLLILKLLGVEAGGHRHIHSPEEIELLVAESYQSGLLAPDEGRRLQQALRLSRRTARELMIPRRQVQGVEENTPIEEILQIAVESPFTRLPVFRESLDNIIGLLHTKDLTAHYAEHGSLQSLDEILRPVTRLPGSVKADHLLATMRENRSRMVVVLDEYTGTAGIVTLEDVVAELLGDVADEFKNSPRRPETLPDGRVRLPGLLRVDEATAWINVHWSNELANTVGGFITAELGHVPQPGEKLDLEGVKVEVEIVEGQTVVSVLAVPRKE